jgi:hypothetical protein
MCKREEGQPLANLTDTEAFASIAGDGKHAALALPSGRRTRYRRLWYPDRTADL